MVSRSVARLRSKLLATDGGVRRKVEGALSVNEAIRYELSKCHTNRVLLSPVVGAVAEDERELV